jgi:hypothetical protein
VSLKRSWALAACADIVNVTSANTPHLEMFLNEILMTVLLMFGRAFIADRCHLAVTGRCPAGKNGHGR